MQDTAQQTPAVDPMATTTTSQTMPAVDTNTTVVTETPAMATEAVVTETPAQVGPAAVDMSELKVELPEVPAPATPVATETPVTPTV